MFEEKNNDFFYSVEISVHHGPHGALSLARAAAGQGTGPNVLSTVIQQQYPSLLVNFNYSSCATVLAASMVLKQQIVVYRGLMAMPNLHISTMNAAQIQFIADQNTTANNRV
jgi:hypothetical protein